MNNFVKGMLVVLILIYILSPVDMCPGPIDDLIALLLGVAASAKLTTAD